MINEEDSSADDIVYSHTYIRMYIHKRQQEKVSLEEALIANKSQYPLNL